MRKEEVLVERLVSALHTLLERDAYLIEHNCNERAICGRLLLYLVPLFKEYDVDIEYNRDGDVPKKLRKDNNYIKIIPDIIIHERGNNDNNILVIETKKDILSTHDHCKVKQFMKDARLIYRYGAQIAVGATIYLKLFAGIDDQIHCRMKIYISLTDDVKSAPPST